MSLATLVSNLRALKTARNEINPSDGESPSESEITNRLRTCWEKFRLKCRLFLIAAVVGGIEFCYAAETAFVSPLLLQLGVPVYLMTLTWMLSPLIGFFLVPVLGSCSDTCRSKLGRRRPFIILYSAGIIIGLLLVPYGKNLGMALGDISLLDRTSFNLVNRTSNSSNDSFWPMTTGGLEVISLIGTSKNFRGIILTILGMVLLDSCCDACQTPCRTLMIDSTSQAEQPDGLTTFTVVAGLGGSIGYVIGGGKWQKPISTDGDGDLQFFLHVDVVFGVVLVIYVICFILTLLSVREKVFGSKQLPGYKRLYSNTSRTSSLSGSGSDVNTPEVPLHLDEVSNDSPSSPENSPSQESVNTLKATSDASDNLICTATFSELDSADDRPSLQVSLTNEDLANIDHVELSTFLKSIVFMPKHMWILCATNLCSWMSLVSYSLYFTDFMGQHVYKGDPRFEPGSIKHQQYVDGVRMGSYAMVFYSLSCTAYSLFINRLCNKLGTRLVYVLSQFVYTIGSALLSIFGNVYMAFFTSITTGFMYATLFTLPYILVARYHTDDEFTRLHLISGRVRRGLGTDVAIVSSMVFAGQFLLSSFIGPLIHAVGSTLVVPVCCAFFSFCGCVLATQVEYLGK